MAREKIDPSSLDIAPLAKGMLKKGAFNNSEPEFQHLTTWLITKGLHSQLEKKSKTYIASLGDERIAFITISNGILDHEVEGVQNTTSFEPQVLLIGKLYVSPEYRSSGIGKILLQYVLGIAVKLDSMVGCLGLIVDSNSNPKTVKFYKDFGFIEIDKENQDGEETIKMFFKLPNE